jgi:hypothetical protein
VVLRLLDDAPPEQGHAVVGAGPLEDLVNDHGDALAERIEQLARRRPDFAASLAAVAVDESTLQPDTRRRLSRWVRTTESGRAVCGYLLTSRTAAAGPGCCRGARRDALSFSGCPPGRVWLSSGLRSAGHRGEAWLKRGLPGSK